MAAERRDSTDEALTLLNPKTRLQRSNEEGVYMRYCWMKRLR